MFVLVTDDTLRKIMSSNDQGIIAVTGRAHCQRQVAFFFCFLPNFKGHIDLIMMHKNNMTSLFHIKNLTLTVGSLNFDPGRHILNDRSSKVVKKNSNLFSYNFDVVMS